MESALRLGYVPSPSAAGLASGQTRTVAVIVPMVTRWFFAAVVQGAEEVLRERGYDLLLYNLAGDATARHRVFATSLLTKRVDAVLVLSLKPTAEELDRLGRLGRPVTIVGADMPGWATVRIDDRDAAATATAHLVSLGHRRVGYIGGATEGVLDFTAPTARLDGFRCTLEAAGIAPAPELEQDGEFTIAGGDRATRTLLALPDPPTAIFAASDEMAMGVLRAARELGVRVPQDLSVIGLDDHELADYFELTTVAQPVQEQGRVAAMQVLAALSDGDWQPTQVILPTHLVVRRTTAAPARQPSSRRRT
nr:LacI family DNA-binding transcriptional regulator [Nocardioides sp. MAH-18]